MPPREPDKPLEKFSIYDVQTARAFLAARVTCGDMARLDMIVQFFLHTIAEDRANFYLTGEHLDMTNMLQRYLTGPKCDMRLLDLTLDQCNAFFDDFMLSLKELCRNLANREPVRYSLERAAFLFYINPKGGLEYRVLADRVDEYDDMFVPEQNHFTVPFSDVCDRQGIIGQPTEERMRKTLQKLFAAGVVTNITKHQVVDVITSIEIWTPERSCGLKMETMTGGHHYFTLFTSQFSSGHRIPGSACTTVHEHGSHLVLNLEFPDTSKKFYFLRDGLRPIEPPQPPEQG